MGSFAFTNVNVVDIEKGITVPAQTVIISGNLIEKVGPVAELHVPNGTICIAADGKTIIPGLVDMHVHIIPASPSVKVDETTAFARATAYAQVFLTAGVTTVRNMAGTSLHTRLREQVAQGTLIGPRIFTCGPILETRFTFPEMAEIGELVRSATEARTAVIRQKLEGYDFIKVYNDIDADIYDAIMEAAKEIGIRVVGHVAFQKGLHGALAAKQSSIEHLRSYDFAVDTRTGDFPWERYKGWLYATTRRIEELAEQTAAAGVWNAPTLVVEHSIRSDDEIETPRESLPFFLPEWMKNEIDEGDLESMFSASQRQTLKDGRSARGAMVVALDRVGAGVLAGSDCPGCRLVPGRSLIKEIELLVASGLSPWRALCTATVNAVEFLGLKGEGVIASGKRADLVLLEANPLKDISALHRTSGVVANGTWLARTELEQMICRNL